MNRSWSWLLGMRERLVLERLHIQSRDGDSQRQHTPGGEKLVIKQ